MIQIIMFQQIIALLAILLLFTILYFVLIPYVRYRIFIRTIPKAYVGHHYPFVPILGHFFLKQYPKLMQNATSYLSQKAKQLQNVDYCTFNIMNRNGIEIHNIDLIKSFSQMQSAFIKQQKFHKLYRMVLGQGLIFAEADQHKHRRKLISQVFNFEYINGISKDIHSLICGKVAKLSNKRVEVLKSMIQITSNIILTSFLGFHSVQAKVEGVNLSQFINQFMDQTNQQTSSLRFLIFGKASSEFYRKYDNFHQTVTELVKSNLCEAKSLKGGKKYLIELLYQKDPNGSLKKVVEEFKTFFFAGTDTSSHLASVCLYFLTQHPNIQNKITQQIQQFNSNSLNFNSGKQYKILNAFIKQVQRIYGPVNEGLMREATQDLDLRGIFIPKGTVVITGSDYNMHKAKFYQNPQKFDINRWLNQDEKSDPFTFITFGSGSRNCIGQHLALFQILRRYRFEGEPGFNGVIGLKGLKYFKDPFYLSFYQKN